MNVTKDEYKITNQTVTPLGPISSGFVKIRLSIIVTADINDHTTKILK
jgi:hypothetical protein